jgi:hypothetical protein
MENEALKELKFEDLDLGENQIIRIVYSDNRSEYVAVLKKGEKSLSMRPLITLGEYKLDGQSTTYVNLNDGETKMYPLTSEDEAIVDTLLKKVEKKLNKRTLKHTQALEEIGAIKFKVRALKKVKE